MKGCGRTNRSLVPRASTQGPGQKIGLFWPVAFHFVNSIGFAHLLPVSLALYAKYAPKSVSATIIGLYYLAFFAANKMVGRIGALLYPRWGRKRNETEVRSRMGWRLNDIFASWERCREAARR